MPSYFTFLKNNKVLRSTKNANLLFENRMNRILHIESIYINQLVSFIKRYSEYNLQKSGIVWRIEDEFVLVKTEDKIIYKIRFSDAEFYN